jgi:hypothetical protein
VEWRRGESNSRKTKEYYFNRACPEVAEGNSRELKRYSRTRKCKTQGKGERGEKGKKTQRTSCFSLFPFFHFAFVTQESKPNTMDLFTEKWVNSKM